MALFHFGGSAKLPPSERFCRPWLLSDLTCGQWDEKNTAYQGLSEWCTWTWAEENFWRSESQKEPSFCSTAQPHCSFGETGGDSQY